MTKYLITLALMVTTVSVGQELDRRAAFISKIAWPTTETPGAPITELVEGSPIAEAGYKKGDLILAVNDRSVKDSEDWSAITYSLRANHDIKLQAKRKGELITATVRLPALPYEQNNGVTTHYETVISDFGIRQRAIITVPEGKESHKNPAIILIQGLSCSSVEKYSGRSNNWVRLIKDLVENSNMVLMRIEKPGVGDSEGDCGKVDFKTELNGYESAIRYLKDKPYVDTDRIVVYGNSMGSALAPYLANTYDLAGVISDGTFFKTWFEHMLEIERRILNIEAKSQAEIQELMNTVYIPLYYEMLIKKRSFEDILKERPRYRKHHRQGLQHMYGRSMTYYHQVQDFNFAEHWENLKVPLRVRWGTNDWIMTENDNDMIMDVLTNSGHANHSLYKYKNLDHWSTIHPDYANSYYFKPGKWEPKISQQIIDWAWDMVPPH